MGSGHRHYGQSADELSLFVEHILLQRDVVRGRHDTGSVSQFECLSLKHKTSALCGERAPTPVQCHRAGNTEEKEGTCHCAAYPPSTSGDDHSPTSVVLFSLRVLPTNTVEPGRKLERVSR